MKTKQPRLRLRIAVPAIILLLASLIFSTAVSAQSYEGNNIKYSSISSVIPESSPILVELKTPSMEIPNATPPENYNESDNIPSLTEIQKGINYLSQWVWYRPDVTSDGILHRDFSKFQKDGIKYISLPLFWYRLEGPTRGDFTGSNAYGDAFLANIKRVIQIADQYDIQTMVFIATIWNSTGTWSTPEYVLDPVTNSRIQLAIVRDDNMQQAFLDMFTHTINYLKGTPGIWCWALNEPWYWPHKLNEPYSNIDQKENFIALFQKMGRIVHTLDEKPFTVKFVSTKCADTYVKDIFLDDWMWDKRIFSSVDFISFDIYPTTDIALYSDWKASVSSNISGCIDRGKKVWITEFGTSLSREDGIDVYRNTLDFFTTLPVAGIFPWMWRSDKELENPDPPNIGYNICASSQTGEGNEKYNIFVNIVN